MELPALKQWTPTRDTLQAYAKVLGAIRGATHPPHPQWWHISLQPQRTGLTTGPLESADGPVRIDLNIAKQKVILTADGATKGSFRLGEVTATELGESLLSKLTKLGIEVSPPAEKWQSETPRPYDTGSAHAYLDALNMVADVFRQVHDSLPGRTSPVQLWPHHFDLSFEWFSEKQVSFEEHGETQQSPAQIGFGFSTGDEGHPAPYFYANPWEFDDRFLERELPGRARWNTEGWKGSLLAYSDLEDSPRLAAYLRGVFEIAAPVLS